jgi:hypothetical protein
VTVQENLRGPRTYPHHERRELAVRPRTPVAARLYPPRLEPAVDEINRGLGPTRRVRPVADEPPRKREDLGLVCRYRQ